MACVSGTNIVNDGLVFHFDLENGVKSWKGKPTSNLISTSGIDITEFSRYLTMSVEIVEDPESFSGYALKMYQPVAGINSASRSKLGNADNIPDSGSFFVSVYAKRTNSSANIIPFVFTGENWYSLQPLDNDSIYLTEDYRRFGRYVSVGTNSGGPTPAFSMTKGGDVNDTQSVVHWHSPQLEDNLFATTFVNGIRLDTASIIDLSPNRNTITAANLTYRQDDTPTFDGTNDTLYAGNILNFGTGDLTLESWFKKSSDQNGWRSVFQKGTSGIPGYGMHIYNNRLSASIQATYNQHNTHSDTLLPDMWYNCLIVFDRDTGIFSYINGELVGNYDYAAGNDGSIDTTSQIQIGGYNSVWNFHGEISQVKIYNKALTAQEVKQNFEATRTRYGI